VSQKLKFKLDLFLRALFKYLLEVNNLFNYGRQYGRQFMTSLKERRPELFQTK